jgi:acyl-CoA thioester hydrolase
MVAAPIVFKSKRRISFSDLDPYDHVGTAKYAAYYVDHRMEGLHDNIGWDLRPLRPCRSWSGSGK